MLAVLSPAKNLDFSSPPTHLPRTQPVLSRDAAILAAHTRRLSPGDLRRLMDLSDRLADLNYARFQNLGSAEGKEQAKQAVLAFAGDTYIGLKAGDMTASDLEWAQERLRILSGLYGVLRPLDAIEPYRLEMGTRLDNERGQDLYAFWKGRIAPPLDQEAQTHKQPVIINLASTEYFKAAKNELKTRIITPTFHEEKNGKSRVIGLMAKRARGMMARYIITNRLERAEDLKTFGEGGYRFIPDRSNTDTWVFSRPQP